MLGITGNPISVQVGGQSTISIQASDPDGDSLIYDWSASCGSLSSMTGKDDKIYTAPSTPDTCTVRVTVTDPTGASVTKSVDIKVTSAPSTTFATGDRVQVNTGNGSNLNVRSTPGLSGAILGVQADGSLGTIIGGSVFANGFRWWQVNFDTGPDGWVAEDFLRVAPALPIQAAYASFSVFNRAAPRVATGLAVGAPVAVFNRTIPTTETTGERVATTDNLNVRSAPSLSGMVFGIQPPGNLGTVISGPVFADGVRWWFVDFDIGADGWVAGDFLEPPLRPIQGVHATFAVFNTTAPEATLGHVEGPVFSVDNVP